MTDSEQWIDEVKKVIRLYAEKGEPGDKSIHPDDDKHIQSLIDSLGEPIKAALTGSRKDLIKNMLNKEAIEDRIEKTNKIRQALFKSLGIEDYPPGY